MLKCKPGAILTSVRVYDAMKMNDQVWIVSKHDMSSLPKCVLLKKTQLDRNINISSH